MTFGFALLLAGFVLLDAGWKGTTPFGVLKGVTQGASGPGGVLKTTGLEALNSFTPSVPSGAGGGNESTMGLPEMKQGAKRKEASLKLSHPELHPAIIAITAIVLTAFPKLEITATTNGTHASGSYHYMGRAVDLARPMTPQGIKEMNTAAKWINRTLSSVLTEGIHNPGLSVKDKKRVPPSFWGSETWSAHANHIHLAM